MIAKKWILRIEPPLHVGEGGAALVDDRHKPGHRPAALQNGDRLLTVRDSAEKL